MLGLDITAVPDFDNNDDHLVIGNGVEDSVPSLSHPVAFLAGKFLAACAPRIICELGNPVDHVSKDLGPLRCTYD